MKHRVKVDSEQLYILHGLVNVELERIKQICRTGVGMEAIAANERYISLSSLFRVLNEKILRG